MLTHNRHTPIGKTSIQNRTFLGACMISVMLLLCVAHTVVMHRRLKDTPAGAPAIDSVDGDDAVLTDSTELIAGEEEQPQSGEEQQPDDEEEAEEKTEEEAAQEADFKYDIGFVLVDWGTVTERRRNPENGKPEYWIEPPNKNELSEGFWFGDWMTEDNLIELLPENQEQENLNQEQNPYADFALEQQPPDDYLEEENKRQPDAYEEEQQQYHEEEEEPDFVTIGQELQNLLKHWKWSESSDADENPQLDLYCNAVQEVLDRYVEAFYLYHKQHVIGYDVSIIEAHIKWEWLHGEHVCGDYPYVLAQRAVALHHEVHDPYCYNSWAVTGEKDVLNSNPPCMRYLLDARTFF